MVCVVLQGFRPSGMDFTVFIARVAAKVSSICRRKCFKVSWSCTHCTTKHEGISKHWDKFGFSRECLAPIWGCGSDGTTVECKQLIWDTRFTGGAAGSQSFHFAWLGFDFEALQLNMVGLCFCILCKCIAKSQKKLLRWVRGASQTLKLAPSILETNRLNQSHRLKILNSKSNVWI